ncbi:expressed protein [Phakopsora pachyrhizi]|uniref:Expressed protein n=1 Tax=Phakopsora pachyrhizi TaxID=170000 RepID=A0AAV0AJX0_PHAPC|nr:expressed protein [Phakopsora pachyrhizi]
MTTAKLVKGPSDLESQGTGKRREDSSSNSTENLTESHPKNGSHTSHDRPLTSSEPILPSPTNYFGFKRSGKNMTPEQRSTFEELRRIVLKRCATDPVWDAERDWLLGSPNDTSRPGSLHALVIRGRKSVIQTLEKGVQRRRDAATERGEPYPSSRTDLKTSKDCYNEEYESPKGTDTAATVRAGLYSSPLRGDNNKVDFDHSEKLGQSSSRSDSIHSDKRVSSSSHEAEMVKPNLPDSSHSETLTTASLPARLAKTESRPSSLQPSASSSKPASEPGYSSLMSDLLITGNFLIWTSKPKQPASVRNPVSAADVLELPPIITDTLTTRYLAYQTLSHLIKLHKDHRRPTPENLAHTCHRLKQDVEGPWAQIKDLFLQAKSITACQI